jgi:hypothetical protein
LPHAAVPRTVARLDEPVPILYTRATSPRRLGPLGRLVAAGVALACLTVLTVAAYIQPNRAGVGSHSSSLGLPRCGFLETTRLPCPSCGMTTSFSHFARGNLVASAYVQPMGAVLAALACGCVWAGLYVAFTGRPVYRLVRLLPGKYYLMPLFALALLAWAWKIMLRLNGWDGWG